ncbi:hypothetical protein DIPPA_04468 [Diplonema papillatum]|nr:hypothetical protein DIPPA_04468 [Diplonema papillatum]|eukprot:gene5664-8643_t
MAAEGVNPMSPFDDSKRQGDVWRVLQGAPEAFVAPFDEGYRLRRDKNPQLAVRPYTAALGVAQEAKREDWAALCFSQLSRCCGNPAASTMYNEQAIGCSRRAGNDLLLYHCLVDRAELFLSLASPDRGKAAEALKGAIELCKKGVQRMEMLWLISKLRDVYAGARDTKALTELLTDMLAFGRRAGDLVLQACCLEHWALVVTDSEPQRAVKMLETAFDIARRIGAPQKQVQLQVFSMQAYLNYGDFRSYQNKKLSLESTYTLTDSDKASIAVLDKRYRGLVAAALSTFLVSLT